MSSSKALRNAASALFREGGPNLGPKLPATGQDQAAPRSTVSRTQRWKSTLIGTRQDWARLVFAISKTGGSGFLVYTGWGYS